MGRSESEPCVPLAWFEGEDAHAFMERCFDQWECLTAAERQPYDGWVGGYVLAQLADDNLDSPPPATENESLAWCIAQGLRGAS